MRKRVWRVIHNVIAHPLMEVLPASWGDRFHDWTASKAFPQFAPEDRR
jgi:hypothetical protein